MGSQTDSNIINSLIIHLNTTKWSWSLNSQQTFAKVNMEFEKKSYSNSAELSKVFRSESSKSQTDIAFTTCHLDSQVKVECDILFPILMFIWSDIDGQVQVF